MIGETKALVDRLDRLLTELDVLLDQRPWDALNGEAEGGGSGGEGREAGR